LEPTHLARVSYGLRHCFCVDLEEEARGEEEEEEVRREEEEEEVRTGAEEEEVRKRAEERKQDARCYGLRHCFCVCAIVFVLTLGTMIPCI
jgi:hypothetical protein